MAARKVADKKKQKKNFKSEVGAVIIVALSLFVLAAMFLTDSSGNIGLLIKSLVLGIFGTPGYLLPLLFLIGGSHLIVTKDILPFMKQYSTALLLLIILGAIIEVFTVVVPYDSFFETAKQLYIEGKILGGGILGGFTNIFLEYLIGSAGAMILYIVSIIFSVMVLFNTSIIEIARKITIKINTARKERKALLRAKKNRPLKPSNQEPVFSDNIFIDSQQNEGNDSLSDEDDIIIGPDMELIPETNLYTTTPVAAIDKNNQIVLELEKDEDAENKFDAPDTENHFIGEYIFPPLDLLHNNTQVIKGSKTQEMKNSARKLVDTLSSFGVHVKVLQVSKGPAITRFELQPQAGVKVSKIVNLADDIALNLAAPGVRIEAPIPGKAAIGIEVPNTDISMVLMKEVIDTPEFTSNPSKIAVALGKDISGKPIIVDIAKMPHLLIAGATGSGKSVCINSLITSILYKASPEDVRLLMIDPKVVELSIYNGIPHLDTPVVTNPKKAAGALSWAVSEMTQRYELFAENNVRDLKSYNAYARENEIKPLPQILMIIDELADLMMVAPREVEDSICRLAQLARAAGMHLIIATQRPSVDVITGIIKANIPSRISFSVSSQVDSRTILDSAGAEKLLGKGDMLYHPVGASKPIRIQGAFISDKEVESIVTFVKEKAIAKYDPDIIEHIEREKATGKDEKREDAGDNDELLPKAMEIVVDAGQASASLLQRRLSVGYARAGRIVDQMEARGIIGPSEGSKPRQVLISRQQFLEMQVRK